MTIIHLTGSLGGGGAQQMVFQLAKRSHPVTKTIVISVSNVNTLEEQFSSNEIEIHYLNINSFKNSSLTKGLKKLDEVIQGNDDKVLHCHQFHAVMLGVIYRIFYAKIPIVFTVHTNKVASIRRKLFLFISKSLRKKDIIFSNNSVRWYLKNSMIIPNGVDFETLTSKSERNFNRTEPFIFLFLGRLNKPKNPLYLIELSNYLIQNNEDNFIINIVGEGHMMAELKNGIESYNLNRHFEFSGFQQNIKQFLERAHCLILPSLWEGMPLAVLEAAAMKLPILATPVGSIPDFLDQTNAYIHSLDEFPNAMKTVIENYDEAILKASKLYKDLKLSFDINHVFNEHYKLYTSLI